MNNPSKHTIRKGLFTLFFLVPLMILVQIPVFLAGVGLATYLVFSKDLPEVPVLMSYQPKTVSTFFADDGTVIGVFSKEKRFVVDTDQIPPHVVNAFVAAEDARFFDHPGVDWIGFLRAAWVNVKARGKRQGGSTITMQVTRNFLLTKERTIPRKIKEIILALRLDKAWGKQKVLYIYLNEIYLGDGCYGVEAAARGYFGKPVEHLTVAEAALIAGLVPSPSQWNPFKSEQAARHRQAYVLSRMLHNSFITEEEYQKAKAEVLQFKKEPTRPFDLAPDFTEAVRRYIVENYGEEKLYNEGLKVFTTCRVDFQRKALESLEKGVEELRTRQKHLAILRTVPVNEISELISGRKIPELIEGRVYQGAVVKVTTLKNKEVELHVALSKQLPGRVRLAPGASPYRAGHVLALRFDKFMDNVAYFAVDNNPKLQGAFVCIENRTGYVRALVGGVTGELFQFNRATQARRQPGSAFKPVIYSVALEQKSYSPATVIIDEPTEVVLDAGRDSEKWEPRNAGGDFLGPLSLRRSLELSRNICTIKLLMDVSFDPVIKTARKMGIASPLGRNLSLSLGTSEVSLLELTSAFTVFPNSGIHVSPVLVKRIEDRFGNVLEDNTEIPLLEDGEIPRPVPREEMRELLAVDPATESTYEDDEDEDEPPRPVAGAPYTSRERPLTFKDKSHPSAAQSARRSARVQAALSPQTAYIMTSLLHGGVTHGTGARLSNYLKRKDLAGKTGTTNNAEDAWFIGFSPDFTAGAWVGFDDKRPLGRREEGARAALPIWGYFMQDILGNRPEKEFPVPPDIVFQEMVTFSGNSKEGFRPMMVKEPVYKPFAGKTLVLSPLDSPQTLASYVPYADVPPAWQIGPTPPPVIYPLQPGAPQAPPTPPSAGGPSMSQTRPPASGNPYVPPPPGVRAPAETPMPPQHPAAGYAPLTRDRVVPQTVR